MANCRKHGYYLNVNGCPDCFQWKTDRVIAILDKLRSIGKR